MGRVLVLGATGMLGSAVFAHANEMGVDVRGTTTDLRHRGDRLYGDLVEFRRPSIGLSKIAGDLSADDWVINCIGLIKHNIDEFSLEDRRRAISLNSSLPHELDVLAREQGFRVIQIATDCVYSGSRGGYLESSLHDESDVYGQTKSLGEVPSPQFMHIRASIIGRELRTHRSLVEWALGQPAGARLNGFVDHFWNGVTTVAFARIALGLIANDSWAPGTSHLIPADSVSKYELLELIFRAFGRDDVVLKKTRTAHPVDRTLMTISPEKSDSLWRVGGYENPPTIEGMIAELADTQRKR